ENDHNIIYFLHNNYLNRVEGVLPNGITLEILNEAYERFKLNPSSIYEDEIDADNVNVADQKDIVTSNQSSQNTSSNLYDDDVEDVNSEDEDDCAYEVIQGSSEVIIAETDISNANVVPTFIATDEAIQDVSETCANAENTTEHLKAVIVKSEGVLANSDLEKQNILASMDILASSDILLPITMIGMVLGGVVILSASYEIGVAIILASISALMCYALVASCCLVMQMMSDEIHNQVPSVSR
ncbi:MAG: hypothetical protein QG556_1023, partial [Pseudomonadota bacterium]|nr:hypothetical protein [Pseudomonadota bacterium]